MVFNKGVIYPYPAIESAVSKVAEGGGPILGINAYGLPFCGQQLLVVDDGQKTFSFVLSGSRSGVFLYDCVFAG